MADKIDQIPFKIVSVDTAEHEVQIDSSLLVGITSPMTVVGEVTVGTITFSVGKAINSQSGAYAAASNKTFMFPLPLGVSSFRYKATTIADAFNGSVV